MAFFLKLTSGFVLSCVSCVRSFCWHRGMQALQAATISGCQTNNAFQGNQSHFHSKKYLGLADKCWQDSMQMHGHIFKLETKWTWCAELVGSKVSILPSRNFRVCCRNMSEKKFPARAPMVSNSGPSAHINISPTDQTCSDPVSPRIFWSSSQDSSMPTPLAVLLVVLALELLVANGSWWKLMEVVTLQMA